MGKNQPVRVNNPLGGKERRHVSEWVGLRPSTNPFPPKSATAHNWYECLTADIPASTRIPQKPAALAFSRYSSKVLAAPPLELFLARLSNSLSCSPSSLLLRSSHLASSSASAS
jgi:hypothetical protein